MTSSKSTKTFKVGDMEVRVRSAPNLQGATIKYLPVDHSLEVDAASRTEADGYVWWQHAEGWSAERSVDGTQVFLIEKSAVSAPTKSKATPKTPPSSKPEKPSSKKKKTFQVGSVPGLSKDIILA